MTTARQLVLRAPQTPAEWEACHTLRRIGLFEQYSPHITYDPAQALDSEPGHHPFVLLDGDSVVGAIRVDIQDADRVRIRLVVIGAADRGKGYGAELMRQAEAFARDQLGRREVFLFASQSALGFYHRQGYRRIEPGEVAPPLDLHAVPVGKILE